MALHSIELCAGVGMLGEGLRAGLEFLGVDHRTVCYVEREAPAAAQLVALMEAGALDPAPVWSDLLTFRGEHWRGKVDCITAGFPCQDISIAGRRAGLDGKRSGLFFDILDIADACGAWCLALENVSAIATATASVVDEAEGELEERAAARVVGELADRGWDAEWITLSASDVGASHGRARWFCLAWRRELADASSERRQQDARGAHGDEVAHEGRAAQHHHQLAGQGADELADPARHGRDRQHGEAGSGRGVCEAGNPMAHAERAERAERGQISSCGTGCIEGHDGGRRQADGGAGVASEALAQPESHGRHEGRAEPGREQGRPDAAECGCAVADTYHLAAEHQFCEHGRAGQAQRQGVGGCGGFVADTSQQGLSQPERGITGSAGGGGMKGEQLPNFVEHHFSSPHDQPIPDGQESSPDGPGSPRRLNPAFGCWLMGLPCWWTNPGLTSFAKSEMELYRSRQQQHLSCLFDEHRGG